MNENKVQEARNRVFSAETELRKAREALDEELRPKHSPEMGLIISELGKNYTVRVLNDNPEYPLFSVLLLIDNNSSTGCLGNFRKLFDAGLFVGNIGRNNNGVELRFFTKDSP